MTTPQPVEVMGALEPCPFCGDPMKRHPRSGLIRHVDQSELNDCILAEKAFIDLEAWNTRQSTASPLLAEIERLKTRLELTGEFTNGPDGIECRDDTIKLQDERIARQAATIERLQAEVRRLDYNGIHTCSDTCERLPCVQRRGIERLRAALGHLATLLREELQERADESLSEEALIGWLGEEYGRHTIACRIRLAQTEALLASLPDAETP